MFNLSTIVLMAFAACHAFGNYIAYLSPGCDGPEHSLESYRGCVSVTDTRLAVTTVATTTEHHRLEDIAIFVYTGTSCDGSYAQLEVGICYEMEGFHSVKVVYLPDKKPDGLGNSPAIADAPYMTYQGSPFANARRYRQSQLNPQKPMHKEIDHLVENSKQGEHRISDCQDDVVLSSIQDEVVHLVNNHRVANGCSRLATVSHLANAAQGHSNDMASRGYFSHTTPEGVPFTNRILNAGYKFRSAAENIAKGQTSAADVVEAWMKSPGHRANILDCALQHTGVGAATGSDGSWYWTQDFASPA
ncbi:hypothetical protein COCMIDRAFT_9246 [Bipolaris oryzae ATCC 44560]|uniref:SCP domain-containing protein n=1 Tax=Bipolaris oryzae ATCC 44560 TaxID=930090 RepID=W6YTY0_COCMI|nr:uncharacterized protein COCMIDRAFT_9246 [Bipolaris oryzae ATCC 44560]EUC40988.1 hypothetical protein COCMIDRAFT_9246 [Bipolaris oryzae ATCC 44560]